MHTVHIVTELSSVQCRKFKGGCKEEPIKRSMENVRGHLKRMRAMEDDVAKLHVVPELNIETSTSLSHHP